MTYLPRLFLCLLLLLHVAAFADDVSDQQKKLAALNNELKSLQSELSKKQQDVSVQQRALNKVESDIGSIQKRVTQLTEQMAQLNDSIVTNEQKINDLNIELESKNETIAAILRLAYTQNNQPLIKLLLTGSRPEDYARQLYYFSILTDYQQQTLSLWLDQKQTLAQLNEQIIEQRDSLVQQNQELLEQRKVLQAQQNKRAQVIANLAAEVVDTEKQIERKVAEREDLSQLITDLQAQLDAFSLEFPDAEDIRKLKGELAWPVNGRLLNGYNTVIDGSNLRWQGVVVAGQAGTPVRAVQSGQVVFADFFRTHGLLMIVDHGNGVMTLYGRNQTLLKEVGSWVETGEIIAEVGQSGGHSNTGLYFEIRNNGRPENPSLWLKKR